MHKVKNDSQIKYVEIKCPECEGFGGHEIAQICPTCNDRCTITIEQKVDKAKKRAKK